MKQVASTGGLPKSEVAGAGISRCRLTAIIGISSDLWASEKEAMLASANIDGSNRYPPEAQTSNYQVRKFLAYLTKKIVYRQDVLAQPFPQQFSAIDANAVGSGFEQI